MNRVEKLIAELCPDGVEFRELGEVCSILNGYSFKSSKYAPIGIRVIRISDVQKGKLSNRDLKFYPFEFENEYKNYLLRESDLLMSLTGNVGRVAVVTKEVLPAGLNQRVACLRSDVSKVLMRWLFYWFGQDEFEEEAMRKATGGGQKNMSTTWLSKQKIPIPPIEVQQAIVEILDKFTALEAELEAELEARRTQYEYYRDQLLTFSDDEVEWKTLGEVGEFIRGNGLQKKDFTESGVGCIHYGQIYTYYGTSTGKTKSFVSPEFAKKMRKAKKGDLVIATTSENNEDVCKAVVWLGDEEIAVSNDAYIYRHNLNPKYVAYFFQTAMFFDHKRKYSTGTKVIRVSGDNMAKFKIPIPPLAEQERIVGILDKFDALVNDISAGLPAEIAARRKQYEYYRGKLLDFKPLNNGQ